MFIVYKIIFCLSSFNQKTLNMGNLYFLHF